MFISKRQMFNKPDSLQDTSVTRIGTWKLQWCNVSRLFIVYCKKIAFFSSSLKGKALMRVMVLSNKKDVLSRVKYFVVIRKNRISDF